MSIQRAYLVCTTPRCGSGYLCDTLWNNRLFGKPDEYFYEAGYHPDYRAQSDTTDLRAYIEWVKRFATSNNDVFGAKIMSQHLAVFLELCRSAYGHSGYTDYEVLQHLFPDIAFIWLSRRDQVRQAISIYKRWQTGIISRRHAGPANEQDPEYNHKEISRLRAECENFDAQWGRFFDMHSINPLKLVFEDVAEDIDGTLRQIAWFLDIELSSSHQVYRSEYQRLSNPTTEEWVRRYHERESQDRRSLQAR